jgi:hypothetical protein
MRQTAAIALVLALSACAENTGVPTAPDFTKATLVPPPIEAQMRKPRAVPKPTVSGRSGAEALARAQKNVRVQPRESEIEGTIWRIDDVDHGKIYVVPTAPMQPTTIMLPLNETLSAAVAGTTDDFTQSAAVSGDRAAITILPKCASPKTERFAVGSGQSIRPCSTSQAKATFLTSVGPYSFEFPVYDWTAAQIVELNHAPPPETDFGPQLPRPNGHVDMLRVVPTHNWNPAWQPVVAWADPDKLVLEFIAPLPVLPGLYPLGGGVNYSIIETPQRVYMVTDRRVTEAELRVDDQIVRITDPANADDLLRQKSSPRPADWRS